MAAPSKHVAELVHRDPAVVAGLLAKLQAPTTTLAQVGGGQWGGRGPAAILHRLPCWLPQPWRALAATCERPRSPSRGGLWPRSCFCSPPPPAARSPPPTLPASPSPSLPSSHRPPPKQKYRILFALRGIAGADAHAAMLAGLRDPSALFRHEVAYCLGQRQDPAAIATLKQILADEGEHPM